MPTYYTVNGQRYTVIENKYKINNNRCRFITWIGVLPIYLLIIIYIHSVDSARKNFAGRFTELGRGRQLSSCLL